MVLTFRLREVIKNRSLWEIERGPYSLEKLLGLR